MVEYTPEEQSAEFERRFIWLRDNQQEVHNLDTSAKKLEIYSHCKQGNYGDLVDPRPTGWLDIRDKKKWDSWDKLRGMDKKVAQLKCINALDIIYPHK